MNDNEFIEQFENCTLSVSNFDHQNHVRLAWLYLQKFTTLEALTIFSENLKKFAESLDKKNLYHETITFAFFFLINERIRQNENRSQTWKEFAAANPDLLNWQNGILLKFYKAETLASDLARKVFVLPDNLQNANLF